MHFNRGWSLIVILLIAILLLDDMAEGRAHKKTKRHKSKKYEKQALFVDDGQETRETNAPNFVRLVLMRLLYGLAAQMGFEDRLNGLFNGAFVPPNADEDYGDIGAIDGLGDIVGGIGDGDGLFK